MHTHTGNRPVRKPGNMIRLILMTLLIVAEVAASISYSVAYTTPGSAQNTKPQPTVPTGSQPAGTGATIPADCVPRPLPGETPARGQDSGGGQQALKPGIVLPDASTLPPVKVPTIIGHVASSDRVAAGQTLDLTYIVQVPSVPQKLILRSGIRKAGQAWVADTAHDLLFTATGKVSAVTRQFTVPTTAAGRYELGWSLYSEGYTEVYSFIRQETVLTVDKAGPAPGAPSAPEDTVTATPTSTASPTPVSQDPQLQGVDVQPTTAQPGSLITLYYTVTSPTSQQVSLGAGLRQSGTCCYFYDPANDRTLTIPAGTSTVSRVFQLPNDTNVTYDVVWGLWSGGFGRQYGSWQRNNAVQVTGPTPTPSVPQLLDVALAPSTTYVGGSIVMSYTVFSPSGQQVSMGAAVAPAGTGQWTTDPANDTVASIPAGTTIISRRFDLRTLPAGVYDVRWGLWDAGFNRQYGQQDRNSALTIQPQPATATPAPTNTGTPTPVPTNTATPTNTSVPTSTDTPTSTATPTNTVPPTPTATPSRPVLLDVGLSPTVTAPGTLVQLSFTVWSPSSQQVSLGAGMRQSGSCCWFYDPANDRTLTIPAGTSTVTRLFAVPSSPTNITYDVVWGLWSGGFGTQYGSAVRLNALQVTGSPPTPTPTSTPTATPTFTPVPPTPTPTAPVLLGVDVAPTVTSPGSSLVLTYTVFSPGSQSISLGAGIRPSGSCCWTYDPANDRTLTIPAGTSTVTRLFTVPGNASGPQDIIWGLWSGGFGTQYGVQQRSAAVTVSGPTPTPSLPTIVDVALRPTSAYIGDVLVLTYTVFSPVSTQLGLGAGVAPTGTNQWTADPARDRVVSVPAGTSVVTRSFNLGTTLPAGVYDVRWGLWNASFTIEYADTSRTGVLTIVNITATPTNTPTSGPATSTPAPGTPTPTVTGTPPTATNTPVSTITPTGPSLLAVNISPNTATTGGAVTLSYTVYSPSGGTYALGALIRSNANSYNDPGNDRQVTVGAGTSVVTRTFYIAPNFRPGVYNVVLGLWDQCFTIQYGSAQRDNALSVSAATVTPTVSVPTPTQTAVPTPGSARVALGATGPAAGAIRNAGSSFTVSYTIYNTTGASASVKLVARLAPSGMGGYGTLDDLANQVTVTVPPGTGTFNRQFQIPAKAGEGSYDLIWSLVDATTNTVLDTRTAPNHTWVAAPGTTQYDLSLTAGTLVSNSITLQNGVVNRIQGTFRINNQSGSTARAVLRMRIQRVGTTDWVSDLPGDMLVSISPGMSTFTRGFAIPRYLPSGAYNVLWELGDPDFNGTIDSISTNNALQITNPSVIPNVGVPILMYHNINPTTAGGNWVTVCNFGLQMQYLHDHGYTTITGEDIYNYIYKATPMGPNPIWLTFDDSYQNVYDYAYPIMQAYGQRGSIFTVTRYMGMMNYWDLGVEVQHLHMTWNMLQQMHNSGMRGDSHTQHHVHLSEMDIAQQQSEIWNSQRDLVTYLGEPGLNFSYPYGQYPDTAKWLIAHSGFHSATIIGQTKQYTSYADLYELTRIGIADGDNLTTFINKITQP